MEIVNSCSLVSVDQFITDKTIYLTYEGQCWLLSTKASFYKMSNKDVTQYATATSVATNISFQYNISVPMCAGNFTLNHKTGVATEQDRRKLCYRI